MRIVLDLQCCQTAARHRGMGRYSLSLARAMVQVAGDGDQILFGLNAKYSEEARQIVEEFDDVSSPAKFFLCDYPPVEGFDGEQRVARENIASVLRADRVVTLSPDVFHISSLYEGESIWGRCPAPKALPSAPSMLRSVTLYDLIPLVFPDQYLTHPRYRTWFESTSEVLKTADLLLAISESARQDAVTRLGISASQIVNILGAASDVFAPMEMTAFECEGFLKKFGVRKPFIFYVGGPDFRKNMIGLMRGFSAVPAEVRRNYQLVIGYNATPEERREILVAAKRVGVDQSVVLTGFISDNDLAALYNLCDLFLFPSLYEGFGLPVLEAMSCGAATIASNVSSIPEILPRKDCLFDPKDAEDIGRVITSVLRDQDFRQSLRRYSIERAKEFSWKRSAKLALEAFENAHKAKAQRTSVAVYGKAKPKLAYFSPLPPAKSGISSYSAELLPYLADHFEIDAFVDNSSSKENIQGARAVYAADLYPRGGEKYYATLYQVGNSPFHHYMRPYMREHRGVAVLHDAFLGYLGYDPGNNDEFFKLAIQMHGPDARKLLTAAANDKQRISEAILHLTCSSVYFEQSIGVIAHSRFAKQMLENFASLKVAPAIRVIPHLRATLRLPDDSSRETARRSLRLDPDGIYVASFGHIASTKAILELIAAFHKSEIGQRPTNKLLLIGELEGGTFSNKVLDAIAAGPAASRILITGFVDKAEYELYLQAVDIVVQLRNVTRGETSGAVLDALANGLPVVVNRLGTVDEYPEEILYKIMETDENSVSRALDDLASSKERRCALSEAAHAFVREKTSPPLIAQAYADAIHEFIERAQGSGRSNVVGKVAGQLIEKAVDSKLLETISENYIAQEFSERPSRLLIDVTHIRETDLGTGIQRVVREFTKELYQSPLNGMSPQAVALINDKLTHADDYAQKIGARLGCEAVDINVDQLELRAFDRFLMIDASWHLADKYRQHIDRLKSKSGSLYAMVYDIIPLRRPEFVLDFVPEALRQWLHMVVEHASGIACISRAVADDLIAYIRENNLPHRSGLRIGVCHLGADFSTSFATEVSPSVSAVLNRPNLFAMVGTIEPRKNHITVLDAFEKLWHREVDCSLLIIGKQGWMVDGLIERIEQHHELDKRLFRLGSVSDADLREVYKSVSGVIMASHAEGFGLPIFEAAHHGTPIILSDIPVFREVGGDYGYYFPVTDSDALANLLHGWSDRRAVGDTTMRPLTWAESAKAFCDFVFGRRTYFRFD